MGQKHAPTQRDVGINMSYRRGETEREDTAEAYQKNVCSPPP